ncbi:hypothetical protein [Streptococcus sp.]
MKGFQAEAGADVYIVEREDKAGFKLFGFTIDVNDSVGVGVSARAKVGETTQKAETKMKLGLKGNSEGFVLQSKSPHDESWIDRVKLCKKRMFTIYAQQVKKICIEKI